MKKGTPLEEQVWALWDELAFRHGGFGGKPLTREELTERTLSEMPEWDAILHLAYDGDEWKVGLFYAETVAGSRWYAFMILRRYEEAEVEIERLTAPDWEKAGRHDRAEIPIKTYLARMGQGDLTLSCAALEEWIQTGPYRPGEMALYMVGGVLGLLENLPSDKEPTAELVSLITAIVAARRARKKVLRACAEIRTFQTASRVSTKPWVGILRLKALTRLGDWIASAPSAKLNPAMRRTAVLALAVLSAAASAQWKPYYDGYADVVWSKLTGFSNMQNLRYGVKNGQNDVHVFLRNEMYDTNGTDLPFQYAARGTTVGVGYRYWFPKNQMFFTVTAGTGVAGSSNKGKSDLRAGFAGYTEWAKGDTITDLYGDLFYVERAKDTLFTLRVRPGYVIQRYPEGRLWAYSVGQVYASGNGKGGTENRVEAGLGMGYIFAKNFTLNAEARAGYSFRGVITKKSYFNPMVYLAVSF